MELLSPNEYPEVKFEPSPLSRSLKGMFVIHSTTALVMIAATVMVVSLAIFALSAVKGSQVYQAPVDLLSPYNDLFPGQPASALDQHTCKLKQLIKNSDNGTKSIACSIYPELGLFSRIQVNTEGEQISEVVLYAKGVEPEILFANWGRPTLMKRAGKGMSFRLLWENPIYSTTVLVTDSERTVYQIVLRLNGTPLVQTSGNPTRSDSYRP